MFPVQPILGVACAEPPSPANDTNLEVTGYNGDVIGLNANVTYRCKRRTKFSVDLEKESEIATCRPENNWDTPQPAWAVCVESELRELFLTHMPVAIIINIRLKKITSDSMELCKNKELLKVGPR